MSSKNRWLHLSDEVLDKVSAFKEQPSATLYFLSIIVFAGGVGVWLPFIKGEVFSFNNIMTYVFALLSAMLADYLIKKDGSENTDISMLITTMVVFCICFTIVSINSTHELAKIITMSLAVSFLWLLWWIMLEKEKFGPTREEVESSTIGSTDTSSKNKESRSLAAFKASSKKGDSDE